VIHVAHSIFNCDALLDMVNDQLFDSIQFDECLFYRSFINDTYRLTAAGRLYFLRVYQAGWRTKPEAKAEINVIEAIARAGVSVARAVPLGAGGFVFDIAAPEALRHAVLFQGAPGDELKYDGPDGPENALRYGQAIGRFHRATSRFEPPADRPPIDMALMLDAPERIVSSRLPGPERSFFAQLCDRLRERILKAGKLSLGLCHGDLNCSNVHFDGIRETIIDFDCCGWGWVANDVAAFARGVTLHRVPGADASALISSYLHGYRTEMRIAEEDASALPVFLLIQRIWVVSLHLDGHHRWGYGHFGPPYAMRLLNWLRSWEVALEHPPVWLGLS
jgi:Ser/Thr protein kinase RdoA (MazF antagonist)